MTPRRARQKGIEFEREVAEALRVVFPKVKRRLEFQQLEERGVDLDNTGRFKFQCKRLKKYAPVATINEVGFQAWLGEVPVLVTAGNWEPPMAVLPFADLIELLKGQK